MNLTLEQIKTFYTVGNVIFLDYWKEYDLVLDFKTSEKVGYSWQVKVAHCDKEGHVIGAPRWHCTEPGKDKIVKQDVNTYQSLK